MDWQIHAELHWFNVRVDNILRHILLKYGAIKPVSLADKIHCAIR